MPPPNSNRPECFSVNFQREVQAFLFLLSWKVLSREEIRLNLKKIGVETIDEPRPLPHVPSWSSAVPQGDDDWPVAEEPDAAEAESIYDYILENNIPPNTYVNFPPEAFMSLDAFKAFIESPTPTESGNE